MRGRSPREENFEAFGLENTISSHRTSTTSARRSSGNRANRQECANRAYLQPQSPNTPLPRPREAPSRSRSVGLVDDVVSETSSAAGDLGSWSRRSSRGRRARGRPLLERAHEVHGAHQLVRAAVRASCTHMHCCCGLRGDDDGEVGRAARLVRLCCLVLFAAFPSLRSILASLRSSRRDLSNEPSIMI